MKHEPEGLSWWLKTRSCYVCSLRQTCALRAGIDRLISDLPQFIDTRGPSPPPWQWIPVGTARACLFFDFREEI